MTDGAGSARRARMGARRGLARETGVKAALEAANSGDLQRIMASLWDALRRPPLGAPLPPARPPAPLSTGAPVTVTRGPPIAPRSRQAAGRLTGRGAGEGWPLRGAVPPVHLRLHGRTPPSRWRSGRRRVCRPRAASRPSNSSHQDCPSVVSPLVAPLPCARRPSPSPVAQRPSAPRASLDALTGPPSQPHRRQRPGSVVGPEVLPVVAPGTVVARPQRPGASGRTVPPFQARAPPAPSPLPQHPGARTPAGSNH